MITSTATSQNRVLPAPIADGGVPVNRALAERRSTREYNPERTLDMQTVSNLLWACCGINRPDDAHRTNPTAMNRQEIDAYYFDSTGVYLYDFAGNSLTQVAAGDRRALLAGSGDFVQDFVLTAPSAVLLVADSSKLPTSDRAMTMAACDAGIASENINLFCAGNGLVTVTRATMDVDGLREALSLPDTAIPLLNNPVGYPVQ